MALTRTRYPVAAIAAGLPETGPGETDMDGEFDGFECRVCFHKSDEIGDFVAPDPDFRPATNAGGTEVGTSRASTTETAPSAGSAATTRIAGGGSSATPGLAITPIRTETKPPGPSTR
jgi:hypothetical protein